MNYTDTQFDPLTLSVAELQELLTLHDISYHHKNEKSDLIKLFESELIPKLESDKLFDYYNEKSSGVDEEDNDYDSDRNCLTGNRITCQKIHFKDLKPDLITKLILLFFQKLVPLINENPEIKSLKKEEFAKAFIFGPTLEECVEDIKLSSSSLSSSSLSGTVETYFMDDALKLINAKYSHFTLNKHAWTSFGYSMRFFIVDVGPRIFCNTKQLNEMIDSTQNDDILYWDTVLLSHQRNFALAADKSVIKLGSAMVEYLISFTKSSSQHSECTFEKLQLVKDILKEKLDPDTFLDFERYFSKFPVSIWHLFLCLYESDCSTLFTGNDSITKSMIKQLSKMLSKVKEKKCTIKLVNFKNGCSLANPIQHGARFMMNKLQKYDSYEWKKQIKNNLPEIDYMLEEADNYIKSHKNGEKLTFPQGYFATFGETLKV